MSLRRADDRRDVDEMAENILMNDDVLSNDMQIDNVSVRSNLNVTQNRHQPSHSGTQANSALNGHTLSTTSMTLSVKSLNKLNVLAITDDVVDPTSEWKNTFYFSPSTTKVLQKIYHNQIDPLCSYAWPHIMRGNSLITIGNHHQTTMMCLPTLCTKVSVSYLFVFFFFSRMVFFYEKLRSFYPTSATFAIGRHAFVLSRLPLCLSATTSK